MSRCTGRGALIFHKFRNVYFGTVLFQNCNPRLARYANHSSFSSYEEFVEKELVRLYDTECLPVKNPVWPNAVVVSLVLLRIFYSFNKISNPQPGPFEGGNFSRATTQNVNVRNSPAGCWKKQSECVPLECG